MTTKQDHFDNQNQKTTSTRGASRVRRGGVISSKPFSFQDLARWKQSNIPEFNFKNSSVATPTCRHGLFHFMTSFQNLTTWKSF